MSQPAQAFTAAGNAEIRVVAAQHPAQPGVLLFERAMAMVLAIPTQGLERPGIAILRGASVDHRLASP